MYDQLKSIEKWKPLIYLLMYLTAKLGRFNLGSLIYVNDLGRSNSLERDLTVPFRVEN